MEELVGLTAGEDVATNQVLYNLTRRGIEWDVLPWSPERGLPLMELQLKRRGALEDRSSPCGPHYRH
jgi:hypothetical protein